MDNCEIISVSNGVIEYRCFLTGSFFEVRLNG